MLALCLIAAACTANAASRVTSAAPMVRSAAAPAVVVVGEPVKVSISVLVPTWFLTPPAPPQYELPNAAIRRPASSSRAISERIGKDTWSGVRWEFFVYPQTAATFVMRGPTVRLRYADGATGIPIDAVVTLPAVTFKCVVPPAARRLRPVLTATALALRQDIDGGGAPLFTGDVLTRRVEASWTGMPVMFVPSLLGASVSDAITVYTTEPMLTESVDETDGRIAATRTEVHSYRFERPGTYTLPGVSLAWWNSVDEKIEHSSVPPVAIVVASRDDASRSNAGWLALASSLFVLVAVISVVRWWRRGRMSGANLPLAGNERQAFQYLLLALVSGRADSIQKRLERWLISLQADLTSAGLARTAAVPLLDRMARKVGASRFARQPACLRLRVLERIQFAHALLRARSRHGRKGAMRGVLPPLNPRTTVSTR